MADDIASLLLERTYGVPRGEAPTIRYSGPDVPLPPAAPSMRSLELLSSLTGERDRFDVGEILNPIVMDMILGKSGGAPMPKRAEPVASSRPDTVLPSHAFWNRYVSDNPAWHDKIGQAQAATISGLNALGFGAPMTLARRVAPDTAGALDDVVRAHRPAALAADLAGTVANPANALYRIAGDALARKGYGLLAQGAADAGSAAGLYGLPGLLEHGDIHGGAHAMPLAAAARVMMPKLPDNVLARLGLGAGAGALTGFAYMPTNQFAPLYYTAAGAVHGAGLKRPTKDTSYQRDYFGFHTLERERLKDALQWGASLGGFTALAPVAGAIYDQASKPRPPSRTYDD